MINDISGIPFWLMYVSSHLLNVAAFASFMTFLGLIPGAIMYVCALVAPYEWGGEEQANRIRSKSGAVVRWSIAGFILFGFTAGLCPTENEFKAYVAIKVADEAMTSDVGEASKEVIVQ